jgi:5-formyltetrahydrofolate cyclo-ligase
MKAKDLLRGEVKSLLKTLSSDEIKTRSLLIETSLLNYLTIQDHNFSLSVIGLYLPMRNEPQWNLERWKNFPWKLAFPCEAGDRGSFKIPNHKLPSHGQWVSEGEECSPDILVLPALAYSIEGYRLGRGRGWYDRLLENQKPRVGVVGVCFEEQWGHQFEAHEHDQKVNVIITDQNIKMIS